MSLTSPLARAGMYFFPKAEPVREQVQAAAPLSLIYATPFPCPLFTSCTPCSPVASMDCLVPMEGDACSAARRPPRTPRATYIVVHHTVWRLRAEMAHVPSRPQRPCLRDCPAAKTILHVPPDQWTST